MFVDASALVSILLEETEGAALASRIEQTPVRFTSPVAVFETVTAVNRVRRGGIPLALSRVRHFLESAGIAVRDIGDDTAARALDAFARYGKSSGHPARLNMGDCFAYAMARQHGVPLLYNGDDFSQTDLA